MEEIIDIIIKVVATLLALGLGWLGKYLISWLKTVLDAKSAEKLDLFIAELVAAAEQMYKQNDPDGSVRLGYVQDMLIDAGYEVTDAIKALIESKVFSINLTNRAIETELVAEGQPVLGFVAEGGGENE